MLTYRTSLHDPPSRHDEQNVNQTLISVSDPCGRGTGVFYQAAIAQNIIRENCNRERYCWQSEHQDRNREPKSRNTLLEKQQLCKILSAKPEKTYNVPVADI